MLLSVHAFPRQQFILFRVALGCYTGIHILRMLGVINDYAWSIDPGQPMLIQPAWTFYLGAIASLFLIAGYFRKTAAIIIWLVMRLMIDKNIFYYGANYDYIGFLLLLSLFIPNGEGAFLGKADKNWQMPKIAYWGAWIVFAVSMTVSGINKLLISPEWVSGETIYLLFVKSPAYTSEFFRTLILGMPQVFKLITWTVLIYELVAVIALFNKRFRFWYSIATFAFFIGIFMTALMAEVAISAMIFEILLFDMSWLKKKGRA